VTSPFAVSFIPDFKTFLLIHTLFALADRELACISCFFGTVLRDLYRTVEGSWDLLIHSIEVGVIPDLEGLDGLKEHLQVSKRGFFSIILGARALPFRPTSLRTPNGLMN
jgi:hypothetical protein